MDRFTESCPHCQEAFTMPTCPVCGYPDNPDALEAEGWRCSCGELNTPDSVTFMRDKELCSYCSKRRD